MSFFSDMPENIVKVSIIKRVLISEDSAVTYINAVSVVKNTFRVVGPIMGVSVN